jgi:hypothetical protein
MRRCSTCDHPFIQHGATACTCGCTSVTGGLVRVRPEDDTNAVARALMSQMFGVDPADRNHANPAR